MLFLAILTHTPTAEGPDESMYRRNARASGKGSMGMSDDDDDDAVPSADLVAGEALGDESDESLTVFDVDFARLLGLGAGLAISGAGG